MERDIYKSVVNRYSNYTIIEILEYANRYNKAWERFRNDVIIQVLGYTCNEDIIIVYRYKRCSEVETFKLLASKDYKYSDDQKYNMIGEIRDGEENEDSGR